MFRRESIFPEWASGRSIFMRAPTTLNFMDSSGLDLRLRWLVYVQSATATRSSVDHLSHAFRRSGAGARHFHVSHGTIRHVFSVEGHGIPRTFSRTSATARGCAGPEIVGHGAAGTFVIRRAPSTMKQPFARHTPALFSGAHGDRRLSNPEGFPHFLALPTDRPRPAAINGLSRESLALPPDLALALGRFSGSEEDRAPTLLAAFAVLLHRYSGEAQIVVGIPPGVADGSRSRSLVESVTTAQPLWIDLSGDSGFGDLEARVRRQWYNAWACRSADFAGSPQNDASGDIEGSLPQFQVLFSFSSAAEIDPGSLSARECGNRSGRTLPGTELSLHVIERAGKLDCSMEYQAALFDGETVRRMLGHYQVLLREVVANPGERISTLPLLTDAERRELIEEWNQPGVSAPFSSAAFYHEAFAAQAAKTPDGVAVVCEEQQLTFRELDVQSNQLAHYLRRHGVGHDVLVGICLERSPELVVGLLAILKAGGAFVPLEPSYPPAQLRTLLSETRPTVVITQSRLLARLPHEGKAVLCLDTEREAIAAESLAALDVRVTAKNLAAVIFSSGSTGKPKAIARTHHAHRFNPTMVSLYQLCESDRHVLKTSLDSSLIFLEVFWPLMTGGRMIIAGQQVSSDTAALLKLLIDHQITFLALVPSLLRLLVAEAGLEACTSLRHVICFGESLPVDVEQRFCQRLPAALGIFYGTTEAPSLAFRQSRGSGPRPLGNLGYRLGNSQIYILDARLQPVPIGVPGELVAGGPGLAAGYLNGREHTEERLHPASVQQGPRRPIVSDWGPGALAVRWLAGVHRASRRPDQDSWLPRRAGGSRGRARAAPRRARGRGCCPARSRWRESTGCLSRGQVSPTDRQRAADAPGAKPARAHDPVNLCRARATPPTTQWQNGPKRAAISRAEPSRIRAAVRCASNLDGGDAGPHLGRCAG